MTYMTTPLRKKPCPGGHEICNFGRSFLGHYNHILSFSDLWLGVEKTIFKKKNTSILHCLPQDYLPLGVGVMEFTISSLLALQMLHIKELGPRTAKLALLLVKIMKHEVV